MTLTATDVRTLMKEPSSEMRGMLAAKIAFDYRHQRFTDTEAGIANDIFRLLLKDVEKTVRKTLSEQLAHCPQAPHDVIVKLAHDEETEVSAPVLEHSQVLTEDDLIAIARSAGEALRLCAIARRAAISAPLSSALIDSHHEQVLRQVFLNRGAELDEKHLVKSLDNVNSPSLLETLVSRGGLPLTVAEKIFFVASDDLKRQLAKKYKLDAPFMQKAVNDAREWEMLGVVPSARDADPTNDEQIEDLIDELHRTGRLTHSFIMRALCLGSLSIFEAGIAKLASVPRVNARILLLDVSGLGLEAIYKEAGMPQGFLAAIKTLLKISLEETEFGYSRSGAFRKRIIDRIYVEGHHKSVENMSYLLSIIGGKLVQPYGTH